MEAGKHHFIFIAINLSHKTEFCSSKTEAINLLNGHY